MVEQKVEMKLSFESVNVMEKPHWISLDGINVIGKSGLEYVFDFVSSEGNATLLEDGRYLLDFTKYDFDDDFFTSSNGVAIPDWEDIIHGEFKEIFIIGDSTLEKYQDLGPLDFSFTKVSFSMVEEEKERVISLAEEQLEQLNKNMKDLYVS